MRDRGGGDGKTASGAVERVPMTSAERQRRFRERRKAEAAKAERTPRTARGYSWPPFEPGNFAAVKSGIQSERLLVPRAEQILAQHRATRRGRIS